MLVGHCHSCKTITAFLNAVSFEIDNLRIVTAENNNENNKQQISQISSASWVESNACACPCSQRSLSFNWIIAVESVNVGWTGDMNCELWCSIWHFKSSLLITQLYIYDTHTHNIFTCYATNPTFSITNWFDQLALLHWHLSILFGFKFKALCKNYNQFTISNTNVDMKAHI